MRKICFISSFPPRDDGISEFNQDLIKSLKDNNYPFTYFGIAINKGEERVDTYGKEVVCQIRKNHLDDYRRAVNYVNNEDFDVVCLQLEYSLFGGFDGSYIKTLIMALKQKPFVVVHGLPINRYSRRKAGRRKFFTQISPFVKGFIVINPQQETVLKSWGINTPVKQIWHGAPDAILKYDRKSSRQQLHLGKELVILNFGLFHPKKGLEYLIDGFKLFNDQYPASRLILCGVMLATTTKTNYLESIKQKVIRQKLEHSTLFVNRYLSKEELYQYLQAADIVVLPYTKRDLVSSGPLSFAVLAGKYIVTTPFPYAKELLTQQTVAFVRYENHHDIYRAFLSYVENPLAITAKKDKLREISRRIAWSAVGREYIKFFETAR